MTIKLRSRQLSDDEIVVIHLALRSYDPEQDGFAFPVLTHEEERLHMLSLHQLRVDFDLDDPDFGAILVHAEIEEE